MKKLILIMIGICLLSCEKEKQLIPLLPQTQTCWKCETISQNPSIGELPIIMEYCDITDTQIKVLEKDIILEQVTETGYTAKVFKTKCNQFQKVIK